MRFDERLLRRILREVLVADKRVGVGVRRRLELSHEEAVGGAVTALSTFDCLRKRSRPHFGRP